MALETAESVCVSQRSEKKEKRKEKTSVRVLKIIMLASFFCVEFKGFRKDVVISGADLGKWGGRLCVNTMTLFPGWNEVLKLFNIVILTYLRSKRRVIMGRRLGAFKGDLVD